MGDLTSSASSIELVLHKLPSDSPLDKRLILINDSRSPQAAAFRVLRHHVSEKNAPKVLAVTSPYPGAGKTTVAINLALAYNEINPGRVLLLDANVCHPEVAAILRFVPPSCLLDQLHVHREKPDGAWDVVDVRPAGLHVMGQTSSEGAPRRIHAAEFLSGINQLRKQRYSQIILDCPHTLGRSDVNLIQDATDGVLICAKVKQSTERSISECAEQLTPGKILGSVLIA